MNEKKKMNEKIRISKNRYIGRDEPTYIIAEIGSNFDGSLERAKKLIDLAAEVGADCAKFQSFKTPKILSKEGFNKVGNLSFQSEWERSPYEVYKESELPREWHDTLFNYAKSKNIDFMSSPYDREAVDLLEDIGVEAFKIGSGEITNLRFLKYVAKKGKPILLSTGASTLSEIEKAVKTIKNEGNEKLILLQCITQYPSKFENANILAMETLKKAFNVPVGYSDHTPGSVVPLGAVARGGKVIEKHFTDDKTRQGPDHLFAMDVREMENMIKDVRNLEKAMGSPIKDVYPSEKKTRIIQRRGLFTSYNIKKGETLKEEDIDVLRPQLGLKPKFLEKILGKKVQEDMEKGTPIKWEHLTQ